MADQSKPGRGTNHCRCGALPQPGAGKTVEYYVGRRPDIKETEDSEGSSEEELGELRRKGIARSSPMKCRSHNVTYSAYVSVDSTG